MENSKSNAKNGNETTPISENQKGIDNHNRVANHLEEAAKNHRHAAKHHKDGNHEKAAQCTTLAQGHVSLANNVQNEDVEHH
jgi:hypothetical protein